MITTLPMRHATTPEKLAQRLRPLRHVPVDALQMHEVYASIQGEGTRAGLPCTFVRLTACHLRCRWCDTRKAFGGGQQRSESDVLAQVEALSPRLVLVTGGEPLLQPAVLPLMQKLCDRGFTVLLETSGAVSIAEVDPRVIRIMDLKAPGSGEVDANLWENLGQLRPTDELKIVLSSRVDYEWARAQIGKHRLHELCTVLLGPSFGDLDPRCLVDWVLADALPARVQVQLHKYIWDPKTEGV